MAYVLIHPVQIRTKDGLDAEITGLDPNASTAQLKGSIGGGSDLFWDKDGNPSMGAAMTGMNLDPDDPKTKDIIDTLDRLS